MSKETDAIVARHKASGVGGRVTSITSDAPGRKDGTYHQRWGTPSPKDKDGKGLAVDFGDDTGDVATATKLAIFNLFAQESSKLAELFYSHAPFFVKHGVRKPIAQFNREDFARHKNHVHVAVARGMLLPLPPVPVAPAAPKPIQSQEDDEMFNNARTITWPDGSKTCVTPDGDPQCFGNSPDNMPPHFGGMGSLPPGAKLTFTEIVAITPINLQDKSAGYWLWNKKDPKTGRIDSWEFTQRVLNELLGRDST